ncbi:MAG: ATP synthase F1 subunit delta [Mariniphaga sp.]|jgi:F-type H+-transporting ATPase subunit delta|nr:ATP synthase F1 subunit delta [Mariniphaga sp.]
MNYSAISVRYAKALFMLGKEKNLLSSIKEDMDYIAAVCNQSVDFKEFLKNPVVQSSKKTQIIKRIFETKISELSLRFLELIVKNKREVFIPMISLNVLDLIRKEKNIKTALLITASELDEKLLVKTKKILEKELGTKVDLTARTSPHIIGGIILQIDGKQYDASIATQIKKLKKEMLKS